LTPAQPAIQLHVFSHGHPGKYGGLNWTAAKERWEKDAKGAVKPASVRAMTEVAHGTSAGWYSSCRCPSVDKHTPTANENSGEPGRSSDSRSRSVSNSWTVSMPVSYSGP
jgi:hypothetical protein